MTPFVAEFIGTALLILFGNGVVCNVSLARTLGNGGGWLLINAGWGLAVFVGAFCSAAASGAHLNPAVSIAMAVAGKLSWADAVSYIIAQFAGAILGAVLVYLFYRGHFAVTEDPDKKLGCFATGPVIRDYRQNLFCEAVGTFALVFPAFLMASPSLSLDGTTPDNASGPVLGLGAIGLLPVALLVFAIGMSLGGTTGYAINPARDLGPRIAHFLLPIPGKRDSDWQYAWVPVVGPIIGGVVAAVVYGLLVAS